MPQSSVVHPWNNKPLLPIERGIPTYEEMRLAELRRKDYLQAKKQVDDQLETVSSSIYWRFGQREKQEGFDSARRWLTGSVVKVMLPRIARVNAGYRLDEIADDDFRALFGDRATQSPQHNGVVAFLRLRTQRQRLPDLDSQALKSLANAAAHVAATEVARLTHAQGDKGEWRIVYDHYHHLARITRLLGLQPPLWNKLEKCFVPFDAQPAIRRMCDARWWLNSLRRTANRWREHLAIAMGYVHKHASPYVSTIALRDWHEQRRRTNEWRKGMELEDEEGNRISLMDGYAASQANPAIRRTELMVRIRGYENIANEQGYIGALVTVTAPSSHHATLENGHVNRKWNGASPADTQRYLNGVWACARAKCHRQKLRFFGMRSAEPHHDGTPHSHLLVFARPEDMPRILEILRDYAMAADCEELRSAVAANARFDVKAIDPEIGSATGYVAKYISKNIDGYAMDGEIDDESGRPIKESAQRATAWASRWGIRQFQFIGCTPVTVWRELRRLNDSDTAHGLSVEFAACHNAANAPDWAGYVNAQGGPLVKRDDLAVRTWYQPDEVLNQYGEEMIRIRGLFDTVVGGDSPILTRLKQWKIVPKLAVDVSNADALPRSSVNNCTRDPAAGADGVEHAASEAAGQSEMTVPAEGVTVNFDALSRQEKRELAWRLSDDVRSKRKKRPPEREEGAGLSVKEQQISELLALRGIDASAGMVRSVMAGASVACGDLVMTVQDGRLVSRNRAGSGLTVTLTDEGLITSRRASNELPSQIMAAKQQAKNLINRMKVAFRHVRCDS